VQKLLLLASHKISGQPPELVPAIGGAANALIDAPRSRLSTAIPVAALRAFVEPVF
jgi:hypothetical protein